MRDCWSKQGLTDARDAAGMCYLLVIQLCYVSRYVTLSQAMAGAALSTCQSHECQQSESVANDEAEDACVYVRVGAGAPAEGCQHNHSWLRLFQPSVEA